MKQISLIWAFLFTTLLCFGQKEHLEPAKDINSSDSILLGGLGGYYLARKDYHADLDRLLNSGFSQIPYARYTCSPASRAEYAFSVEKINGKNYVIYNKLSENYWYSLVRSRNNSVTTKKTEINNELYLKIGELFGLLTEQTKEKDRKFEVGANGDFFELLEIGVDGESYSFKTTDKNGEIRTGTTWSPHPSNKPMLAKLVKICDDLCSVEIENNIIFQINILKEIELLINGLLPELSEHEKYRITDEDLDKYLGIYSSEQIPLKIAITKSNGNLIGQFTEHIFILFEAIEKDKFMYKPSGIILEFNLTDKTMVFIQGTRKFNLIKEEKAEIKPSQKVLPAILWIILLLIVLLLLVVSKAVYNNWQRNSKIDLTNNFNTLPTTSGLAQWRV